MWKEDSPHIGLSIKSILKKRCCANNSKIILEDEESWINFKVSFVTWDFEFMISLEEVLVWS